MAAAIEVEGLEVSFGDVHAVRGVSFRVEPGTLFGFLGPNGAGKSSTLSVLCTLRPPTRGNVRVHGHDVVREADVVRGHIGVIFQDPSLDDRLTGRENLELHALVYGVPRADRRARIDEALALAALGEAIGRQVRTYSGGMKRRLEIARALIHRPRLLFLDEPTTGLDPQTRRLIWEKLDALRADGTTLFLTTHYLHEAERADRIAIIDGGRIVAEGTVDELRALVPANESPRPPPPGPTLEDVFVRLTGSAVREEGASARDTQRDEARRRGAR